MTDKEKIIDGVDVSRCTYVVCKATCKNTDCYYKQLQRKTAECEQKDKVIKGLHLIIDRLLEASGYDKHISSAEDFEYVYKDMDYKLGLIDELKQECEKLKSQIDADYEDYSQELKTLRNIIENKEKRNARLFVISNNYRKALEEIKQYCKEQDLKYNTTACEILNLVSKAKGNNR